MQSRLSLKEEVGVVSNRLDDIFILFLFLQLYYFCKIFFLLIKFCTVAILQSTGIIFYARLNDVFVYSWGCNLAYALFMHFQAITPRSSMIEEFLFIINCIKKCARFKFFDILMIAIKVMFYDVYRCFPPVSVYKHSFEHY